MRPQLRPYLRTALDEADSRYVFLVDRLRLGRDLHLTLDEAGWLEHFDGQRTLAEIQKKKRVSLDALGSLADRLERNAFLEGPRFRELVEGSIRPPSCLEVYDPDPDGLSKQLRDLFTARGGPGLPTDDIDNSLRGLLIPHMDYARGGVAYGWAGKELAEHTEASLFVILATSHYSSYRFTLTRKHFATPFGVAETDQEYVDRIVRHYGPGLFDDELLAHFPEHSIELEVVLMQFLFERRRPFRIVPLLIGSFHDSIWGEVEPRVKADVARMIAALKRAEQETKEKVCYIISGDLAHIGPKFGDPRPVTPEQLEFSRERDLGLLRAAERVDAAGYAQLINDERDARNICGYPPTYTFLQAALPHDGRTLHYGQYRHPLGFESVSFASVGFYR